MGKNIVRADFVRLFHVVSHKLGKPFDKPGPVYDWFLDGLGCAEADAGAVAGRMLTRRRFMAVYGGFRGFSKNR